VKGGFRIGRAVTFGIVATNRGPNAAQNVTVTDVLPANVNYISAVTTRGTCSYASATRTVTCTVTQLNRNQVLAISILTQRTSGGAVVNTATVSSATSDPVTGNNSSTAFVR
jgi:large repetitive protein